MLTEKYHTLFGYYYQCICIALHDEELRPSEEAAINRIGVGFDQGSPYLFLDFAGNELEEAICLDEYLVEKMGEGSGEKLILESSFFDEDALYDFFSELMDIHFIESTLNNKLADDETWASVTTHFVFSLLSPVIFAQLALDLELKLNADKDFSQGKSCQVFSFNESSNISQPGIIGSSFLATLERDNYIMVDDKNALVEEYLNIFSAMFNDEIGRKLYDVIKEATLRIGVTYDELVRKINAH